MYIQRAKFLEALAFAQTPFVEWDESADPVEDFQNGVGPDKWNGIEFVRWMLWWISEKHIDIGISLKQIAEFGTNHLKPTAIECTGHTGCWVILFPPATQGERGFLFLLFDGCIWHCSPPDATISQTPAYRYYEMCLKPGVLFYEVEVR